MVMTQVVLASYLNDVGFFRSTDKYLDQTYWLQMGQSYVLQECDSSGKVHDNPRIATFDDAQPNAKNLYNITILPSNKGVRRWRRRPAIVEAIQCFYSNSESYTPGLHERIKAFCGDNVTIPADGGKIRVTTLNGPVIINGGDFIIRGIEGEFYPCDRHLFVNLYELIDGPSGS